MFRMTGNPSERSFLDTVIKRSGQNLLECLQCGKCTGSCPVASPEVGGPRLLIAQVLSGMRQSALDNPMWWYCVSCGSCVTRCPVEINGYEVATALCEMAQEEGIPPSEPQIHLLEELFLKSVKKYGRLKELRMVATFNLLTRQPFKDMDKALQLMRKGAFSPMEILRDWKRNERVTRIFSRVDRVRRGSTS